jgi:hypothetical protein
MRWGEFAAAEPDLAAEIRRRLEIGKHRYLATIREDGSPRISGQEVYFTEDGLDCWFGCMPRSRKVRDLLRDPRFALHGRSEDPPEWEGDAKIAGRAVRVTDDSERQAYLTSVGHPGGEGEVFVVDLSEAILTRLSEGGEHLDVALWKPDKGVRTMQAR